MENERQYRYPFVDEILYLESDRHTVTLHMLDGSVLETAEKLGNLEKKDRGSPFFCVATKAFW